MLHETKLHRVCRVLHATCCMEIEQVLFSCNILHQNYINYYDNDNDKHYQKYDQAIKIDNRKSSLLNTSFNNQSHLQINKLSQDYYVKMQNKFDVPYCFE